MKRGQTSVEFLVLFAIVIILVLFVISSFNLFPSLRLSFLERESALYWQQQDISLQSFSFNETHAFFYITHNSRSPVNITSFIIDETPFLVFSYNTSLQSSELYIFQHTFSLKQSDPFDFTLAIVYTNLVNEKEYTFHGLYSLRGSVS